MSDAKKPLPPEPEAEETVTLAQAIAALPATADPAEGYVFDRTNVGKLSKATRRVADGPAPERRVDKAALGSFLSQAFDPYDGLTKEAWEAGAKATEDEYLQREQERQNASFAMYGHDPRFYDLEHQTRKPTKVIDLSQGDRVDTAHHRVPVITRQEELAGDNGVRRTETSKIVYVDDSAPFGTTPIEVTGVRVVDLDTHLVEPRPPAEAEAEEAEVGRVQEQDKAENRVKR